MVVLQALHLIAAEIRLSHIGHSDSKLLILLQVFQLNTGLLSNPSGNIASNLDSN